MQRLGIVLQTRSEEVFDVVSFPFLHRNAILRTVRLLHDEFRGLAAHELDVEVGVFLRLLLDEGLDVRHVRQFSVADLKPALDV